MLVNGSCKNPDGNAIVVDDSEIIGVYESILNDHNKKGDRSDIIIMWSLTALSKLSIRIGSTSAINPNNSQKEISDRIRKNLASFKDHMNIEI